MPDEVQHGSSPPRRYLPNAQLPPYSFVPGHFPHPVSDPRGHMHAARLAEVAPDELEDWPNCRTYLFAVDLFNHAYYWEAHEAWEAVWVAAGRKGPVATLLKGLIKLAAALVKTREGNRSGAMRHVARAKELLIQAQFESRESRPALRKSPDACPKMLGLEVADLIDRTCRQVEEIAENVEHPDPALSPPIFILPESGEP